MHSGQGQSTEQPVPLPPHLRLFSPLSSFLLQRRHVLCELVNLGLEMCELLGTVTNSSGQLIGLFLE